MKKIAIIGAGASGLIASIVSAKAGTSVVVYEKNITSNKKMKERWRKFNKLIKIKQNLIHKKRFIKMTIKYQFLFPVPSMKYHLKMKKKEGRRKTKTSIDSKHFYIQSFI